LEGIDGSFICRVAAYLNHANAADAKNRAPDLPRLACKEPNNANSADAKSSAAD